MRIFILFLAIIFISIFNVKAQTEPAAPAICLERGNSGNNNMTVAGTTTFTFSTLADFSTSQALNNITVNVKSSQKYKLYIAGVMTAITASSSNTPIPINTFTISSTNRGTSPVTVTLSNLYLEVAEFASSTNGINHILTITRNALSDFTQAPGTHTLTLHIRYCQY